MLVMLLDLNFDAKLGHDTDSSDASRFVWRRLAGLSLSVTLDVTWSFNLLPNRLMAAWLSSAMENAYKSEVFSVNCHWSPVCCRVKNALKMFRRFALVYSFTLSLSVERLIVCFVWEDRFDACYRGRCFRISRGKRGTSESPIWRIWLSCGIQL